jgi:drug/metabolite transporter (DMT)-like permease
VLTVLFAVCAAVCNALASLLQRRGASSVPESESMRLALVLTLLRRPVWLFGMVAMAAAFVFQAAALTHGDLALVQPILLAELPITLMLAPLFFDVPAGRRAWFGVIGMSAGLAAVLLAAAPSGGRTAPSLTALLLTVVSTAGLAAALVVVAMRLEGSPRAAAFGLAAGTGFALTAALMKQAMSHLHSHGIAGVLTSWEVYAMVAAGAASLFLWQNALQAGTLVAAQPAITLSDPILATVIGVMVFDERVRLGGWLALELVGALIIAAASVELARSPLVSGDRAAAVATSQPEQDQENQPDLM